ncbi:MAG TPA: hypothetical protein VHD35_12275 [Chitinophagaceae bacterium]|nr:hypothetical protein [Chitinophagaceae bacterium]
MEKHICSLKRSGRSVAGFCFVMRGRIIDGKRHYALKMLPLLILPALPGLQRIRYSHWNNDIRIMLRNKRLSGARGKNIAEIN